MNDYHKRLPLSDRSIALLLIVLFGILYLLFLGVRPLYIPDEVRYGEIAREMIASGDWIVPRLNGLLYFEKPPLGHWMNAISLYVFGENPFAVRFASVFASAISALTVFAASRLVYSSKRTAFLAVFVFLTTFEIQAVGTFSVLDAMFASLLNLGIFCMAAATIRAERQQPVMLATAGFIFGLAFLTKGLLGFVIPALVLGPWLLITRQYDLILRRSWLVVVVAVLTVIPWGLAIHFRQPDFWHYFFWVEHIQRFAAENAQHKAPVYYFLMYLPIVAFPWIYMLPSVVKGLRVRDKSEELVGGFLLLLLWTVMPLVFFSIASGKLITYILPCFAPFSVIVAAGLINNETLSVTRRGGLMGMAAVVLLALVAVVFVVFFSSGLKSYSPSEVHKPVMLTGSMVLAILILGYGMVGKDFRRQSLAPGLAIALVLFVLPWVMPAESLERKAPVDFIRRVYAEVPQDVTIATNGSLVRAVSWATRRADVFVVEDGGETRYGLGAPDGAGRFLDTQAFSSLVSRELNLLLICKGQCRPETLRAIPDTARQWSYGIFFAYFSTGAGRLD